MNQASNLGCLLESRDKHGFGRFQGVIRGSYPAFEVQEHMEAGFKNTELHGCGKRNNRPIADRKETIDV